MASSYSNLKIQLMGTGDNSGQWGEVTNTNLGTAIEEAICESADVAFSGDSQTLTLSDVNTTQVARHLRLNLTGTGSAGITLTVPDIEKNYIINNGLSVDVGIKNSSGAQVTVPDGRSAIVYSTGSGVVDAITSLNTAEITQLTVANTTHFDGGVSAASVLNVGGNITGSSTVSDQDGDLRDIPLSTKVSGDYTLAIGDAGNQVTVNSANVVITVPSATFTVGDIISIISVNGCTATLACTAINAVKAGDLEATALHTLDANGVASVMFSYTADLAVLTGNIS
jgi:hypothetical protein